jgi:hypothetical protein
MKLGLEDIAHINIVNWFHHKYPELADDFHHFANQRKCTPQEGMKLQRMAVKRGVSDFFLGISAHGYHSLWVELKVGNGKLSKEQIAFIKRKNNRGFLALAVWGEEAAKVTFTTYLTDYNNDGNKT